MTARRPCVVCGQALTLPGIDFHQRCATYVYGQGWMIPNPADHKDGD